MDRLNIVLMGVTGCGKTTVGKYLAKALSYPFYDADDLHSRTNVEKMSRGEPLTDTDRVDWLKRLRALIETNEAEIFKRVAQFKKDSRTFSAFT